jgi:hypothetical protein
MLAGRDGLGGFVLRGRVVTLDRQWFVTDEAFAVIRSSVEGSGAPLLAESEAWWGSTPAAYPIVTYGWPGSPHRRVTAEELRLGRDAMLDYLIRVDTGGSEPGIRASVSPEAWFRILAEIAPESVASWPNPNLLRDADRLAALAFQDVSLQQPTQVKKSSWCARRTST